MPVDRPADGTGNVGRPDYGRLAAVGPYFALDTPAEPGAGPPPGFRPLPELYGTGAPARRAGGIGGVGQRRAPPAPRVARRYPHLGLAARFWSVGLGAAVLLGTVPTLEHAWVRIPDQGPLDLWTPPEPPLPAPFPASLPTPLPLADQLYEAVLVGQLEPLAAAVRSAVPLSARLLTGNAASALAGTLRVLDAHAPGPARALVAELLARPPLAGTGTLRTGPRGAAFRRTSCCLYYRVGPGAGVCGDCCFTRPPAPKRG
ncbi:(2Fe-2S)-binding protein [Kitasatospora sp. NPDC059803]|uniref:(2Fe-2S)-binding protein n=1 Tax=Kitasatospora sp. NPDC059803 TaxID=3346953 RepID=UPI0036515851